MVDYVKTGFEFLWKAKYYFMTLFIVLFAAHETCQVIALNTEADIARARDQVAMLEIRMEENTSTTKELLAEYAVTESEILKGSNWILNTTEDATQSRDAILGSSASGIDTNSTTSYASFTSNGHSNLYITHMNIMSSYYSEILQWEQYYRGKIAAYEKLMNNPLFTAFLWGNYVQKDYTPYGESILDIWDITEEMQTEESEEVKEINVEDIQKLVDFTDGVEAEESSTAAAE